MAGGGPIGARLIFVNVRLPIGAYDLRVAPKIPLHPGHPERICWGCAQFCPADAMRCGNGTDRAQHPVELWGPDWMNFGLDAQDPPPQPGDARS